MGYLLHIVLALAALAVAEATGAHGLPLPLAALPLAAVPALIGRWTRARAERGDFRVAAVGAQLLFWSPPALNVAAVSLFGWHRAALEWSGAETALLSWPAPGALVSLLPFVVYQLAAIDARARLSARTADGIARIRRFQARMFLSGLVPVVVWLLVAGLVGSAESVRVRVEEVALYNALFAAALLAVFALFLPAILRNTWDTVPIEERGVRALLDAVAERARFRCKGLYLWRTGHLMSNAAVVGLLPWHRVVLFSDSLVAQLSPRELVAVFAHEIGHTKRHHVAVFVCWVLAFFLGADVVATHAPGGELGAWLLFGAMLGGWFVVFGYMSRRFELDADLFALEQTGDAEALASALERVVGVHARRETTWRHFSTADRVLFLRATAREPEVGERLRRGLRRWVWTGVVACAAAVGLELWTLAASFDGDRVVADLRLGEFAAAEERVDAGADVGEELERVVRRAAAFARSSPERDRGADGERLAAGAARAVQRGDPAGALELVHLAILRGVDELEPVVRALERRADGELGPNDPAWRAAAELLLGSLP